MLEEKDRKRLQAGLAGGSARLSLVLRPGDEDASLASLLEEFAGQVESGARGVVSVAHGDAGTLPGGPALTVARGERGNIHYLALPEGLEAAPFVDLLLDLARDPAAPTEAWARSLAGLATPAELLVFVSAACPHCAQAVRAAHQVALAAEQVTVVIVDAQRFEQLASEFQVRSVPTTLVDRELVLQGAVSPAELTERILSRGSADHGMRTLISLVEAGRFPDVARRILGANGAEELAHAWRRSALSLRMGLMLAAEEVLEEDGTALDGVVEDLLPALDAEDAGLRGDTADLLGRIGHPGALGALASHAADPHPDVAEAVVDAIGQIRKRESGS